MSTFKVKATKTTTGMQVAAGTRGFEITFDEPNSTNTGMNPVEILLTSFGACTAITAQALADKRNFDLKLSGSILTVILTAKMSLLEKVDGNLLKSALHPTFAQTNLTKILNSFLPMSKRSVQ